MANDKPKSRAIGSGDVLGFAGVAILSAGVAAIYMPAGFIVMGACLILIAIHAPAGEK